MSDDGPIGGGLGPGGRQVPLAVILDWHHERGLHASGPVPNCPSCPPAEYARPLPQPLEDAAVDLARLMDWDVAFARELIVTNAAGLVRNVAAEFEAFKAGLPWRVRVLAAVVGLLAEAAFLAAESLRWVRRQLLHPGRPGS